MIHSSFLLLSIVLALWQHKSLLKGGIFQKLAFLYKLMYFKISLYNVESRESSFFFFFGLLHCFQGTSYSGILGNLKQFLAKATVNKEKVQIEFQV